MCGIAGFFHPEYTFQNLKDMTDTLAHRGPDGEGQFFASPIGLGHRRLSIIDTSTAASQPMKSSCGRYITIFNGEIYNFKDLAQTLKTKGYQFNENSDTAVLAPLYDLYGTDMLNHLEGIFTFAIYNTFSQKLFIARDHAGVKPLYYTQNAEGIAFASELKALLHLPHIKKDIDGEALFSYLSYLWCPGERTLLADVKKLLPGHYITVEKGVIDITCWYSPEIVPESEKRCPTHSQLLELIDSTVSSQSISDVPLGSFLSGGVDSSAIVDSLARQEKEPFNTFCIGFNGAKMSDEGFGDDAPYAEKVAALHPHVKLNHLTANANIFKQLPEMVYHLDEPQADIAPLFVKSICEDARQKGIKVLMSGAGADDIFSGYRRHQTAMLYDKVSVIPTPLRKALCAPLHIPAFGKNLNRKIKKLLEVIEKDSFNSLISAFYFSPQSQWLHLLQEDLQNAYVHKNADHLEQVVSESTSCAHIEKMLDLELHGFLPDHNLNYTDKLSMAAGVEVRVPFVTKEMKAFANQIPSKNKASLSQAKLFLKNALEARLPKDVLYRSKTGFGAPIRSWLTGEALPWVKELLLSDKASSRGIFNPASVEQLILRTASGKEDGTYTLLTLLVIEIWFRQFIDAPVPELLDLS